MKEFIGWTREGEMWLVPTERSSRSIIDEIESNVEALEAYFQSEEYTRDSNNFAKNLDIGEWLDANNEMLEVAYKSLKSI